jgi:hypothetical protein
MAEGVVPLPAADVLTQHAARSSGTWGSDPGAACSRAAAAPARRSPTSWRPWGPPAASWGPT